MYLKPDYRQDLFKGTADFYVRYRTPYPESMIKSLINIVDIKENDKLLDLACGPGRLTLPLAKYFNEVVAIDLEEEMIFAGKKLAEDLDIKNIQWITGKAEDSIINSEMFKLATIGDAFHRLDQGKVLKIVFESLKSGGFLAIIGGGSIIDNGGASDWQKILNKILSKWYSPNVNNDNINYLEQFPNALKEFGFKDVFSMEFEEKIKLKVEDIIGFLRSMSIFTKNAIGSDNDEFERTITDSLLKLEPTNIFEYNFMCGYHIGRKNKKL